MSKLVSDHKRSDMKSLRDNGAYMVNLMGMTPYVKRSGREPFGKPVYEHCDSKQQHHPFGEVPLRSNFNTSSTPS